jgi:hypothetical protein
MAVLQVATPLSVLSLSLLTLFIPKSLSQISEPREPSSEPREPSSEPEFQQ